MDTYRRIPTMDPGLPVSLMPEGWPRRAAREMFIELYDGLAPLAVLQVQRIVGRFDGDAAQVVSSTMSAHLLAPEAIADSVAVG